MEKRTIISQTTSTEQIIRAAREYFVKNGYEIRNVRTEDGKIGIQAKKTNLVRKCSGTSYALQVIVDKKGIDEYEITAGWGEWLGKSTVMAVATFVAFGFLVIPAAIGMANQAKLPKKVLESITSTISVCNPDCKVYDKAA